MELNTPSQPTLAVTTCGWLLSLGRRGPATDFAICVRSRERRRPFGGVTPPLHCHTLQNLVQNISCTTQKTNAMSSWRRRSVDVHTHFYLSWGSGAWSPLWWADTRPGRSSQSVPSQAAAASTPSAPSGAREPHPLCPTVKGLFLCRSFKDTHRMALSGGSWFCFPVKQRLTQSSR